MRKFVLAVGLVLMASGAQAATLNVVGGQLLGASGVIVDGNSYNVEFLDGTCSVLYSGCNEASDFTFQTSGAAELAANALLDQVFLDGVLGDFDSDPDLTAGCEFEFICGAFTPWAGNGVVNDSQLVSNDFEELGDGVSHVAVFVGLHTNDEANRVYAVWSVGAVPVPVPGPGVLVGLGLLGVGVSSLKSPR